MDWLEQYSAALDVRDARERAHERYINAYTRLADRTAADQAGTASPPLNVAATQSRALGPDPSHRMVSHARVPSATVLGNDKPSSPSSDIGALRADLSATQKARGALQNEVLNLTTSLAALQTSSQKNLALITQLTKQKAEIERKLRDRDEELRGKARLVEQTQDEMVSLSLQVNMAEQRSERLQKENKDLVDRWMKRMGEEAERVNQGSGWH